MNLLKCYLKLHIRFVLDILVDKCVGNLVHYNLYMLHALASANDAHLYLFQKHIKKLFIMFISGKGPMTVSVWLSCIYIPSFEQIPITSHDKRDSTRCHQTVLCEYC